MLCFMIFIFKFLFLTLFACHSHASEHKEDKETEKFIPFIIERPVKRHPSKPADDPLLKNDRNGFSEKAGLVDARGNLEKSILQSFISNDSNASDHESSTIEIIPEMQEISTNSIKKLINTCKSDLCPINPGGQFEMTLKIDVSGKILGVGASGEGGFKVVVNCDNRENVIDTKK